MRETPTLFIIHPSHTPPSHFPQGTPITESKGNYLKVAQQGTADGGGRNRGGTGGAQQAWPLPEASKGAPGRGGDTQQVGLRFSGMPVHVLRPHTLPLPRVPALGSLTQG